MKRFLSVVLASSLILAVPGCAKEAESPKYGEEIFTCNSDNMFGFEGLYIDGDTLVLTFDEDNVSDELYSRCINNIFDHDELFANDYINILTDGDSLIINADDVEVDGDEYVITIFDVDIDTDEITGVTINTGGNNYTVNIDEEILTALVWGGECLDIFTQEYIRRDDSWSNVGYEQEFYPMTVVDPDFIPYVPDVEPDIEPVRSTEGMVVPYLAEYIEDEFIPENNEYLYGFIDLEGNVIYEPQFRSVQYIEKLGVYIVSIDENGLYKSGLMSEDGQMVTDIIYDGAYYEQGMDESAPEGHINLTSYSDGTIIVTTYGSGTLVEDDVITLDEDSLPYDAATSSLTLCHMNQGSAVIQNSSEFYPHRVLIDIDTGDVLHDFTSAYGSEILFGDLIIDNPIAGVVTVYDMTGESIYADADAYAVRLTPYKFLIAEGNGNISIIDMEGNETASMTVSSNAEIDTAAGHVVINDYGSTTVYDEDLNIVAEPGNYDIDYGYCPGHWNDEYHDAFYFVSFEDDRIYNLISGDSMPVEEGYFYSYEDGFIVADNRGDGNTSDHRWRVYDPAFNLIREEEGFANVFSDEVTGEYYIGANNGGVTTIYEVDTCEPEFEIDGNYGSYVCRAYNGCFCMTDLNVSILANSSGQILFNCDIST